MDDSETLCLANQLCFALYAATNAITRSYRGLLGELGLTYPQYLVLVTLLERPSLTSGELARALRLDAGTLTPMLKRLAVAGLIERTRRAEDERVIDNRLTEKGLALREELVKAQTVVKCRTGLSEGEMDELRAALQTLAASLVKAPERALETRLTIFGLRPIGVKEPRPTPLAFAPGNATCLGPGSGGHWSEDDDAVRWLRFVSGLRRVRPGSGACGTRARGPARRHCPPCW